MLTLFLLIWVSAGSTLFGTVRRLYGVVGTTSELVRTGFAVGLFLGVS
jgi:hypothetical protein